MTSGENQAEEALAKAKYIIASQRIEEMGRLLDGA